MPDLRHRLRPLLHSGISFKVSGAIDEIVASRDPDLIDWALGPATVHRLGGENRFDNWKYGDACAPTHPSLDVASLLRLAGAGTSKRCTELRAALVSLCLEGKPYGELLDISSVRGVAGLRSLRVYGYELESRWEWRAESRPRQVMNLDTLSTLTGLQHLIIANTSGVDVAAIATLPHLRRLELSVTDVADLSPLASTKLESLFVAVSANLTSIDVLPRTLRRLHLEDLPLSSVAGLASLPALEDVYVGGVPLTELPKLASTKATVRFEPARTPRSEFDPVPEL